jgi:hypothetical protein
LRSEQDESKGKKNENKHCHFYFFLFLKKTAKRNERQGAPLLLQKHPFINDAKCCKMKHMRWPLQWTITFWAKRMAFMQTELKNRNTTLHDE